MLKYWSRMLDSGEEVRGYLREAVPHESLMSRLRVAAAELSNQSAMRNSFLSSRDTSAGLRPHDHGTVLIIGAGPAGLTAAYLLAKQGVRVAVLEADRTYVGGLSRTVDYKGFRFDIGGHRFFSKSKEVEELWTEILPEDMLIRPRSSRILYRNQLFSYPLNAVEAFTKLGFFESLRCVLSSINARLFPIRNPRNFEEWVTNQFGSRLFNIFFKTYTEKVWGMSCKEISADWAAQRIKGLSLTTAIINALLPKQRPSKGKKVVKTLIGSFRYPRYGPGMMWECCAARVKEMGGTVLLGRRVTECVYDASRKTWNIVTTDPSGHRETFTGEHVVSTAPMRELASMLKPAISATAAEAASKLKYRDFITVALILRERNAFSDNWIYVHDPSVMVGRIQNFKSWSPEMVPDQSMVCYGLEYFCFEHCGLWSLTDEQLEETAKRELIKLGLAQAEDIVDAAVVRQRKAYPVYDDAYAKYIAIIRHELEPRFPTLDLIGRNGMHKYNNQDHSMMTAMLCVENILAGRRLYDLWRVNEDAEYHEDGERDASVSGLRQVPQRVKTTP
jgi:protoporphyrinogen oxidase